MKTDKKLSDYLRIVDGDQIKGEFNYFEYAKELVKKQAEQLKRETEKVIAQDHLEDWQPDDAS